jgi:hypothetical protein
VGALCGVGSMHFTIGQCELLDLANWLEKQVKWTWQKYPGSVFHTSILDLKFGFEDHVEDPLHFERMLISLLVLLLKSSTTGFICTALVQLFYTKHWYVLYYIEYYLDTFKVIYTALAQLFSAKQWYVVYYIKYDLYTFKWASNECISLVRDDKTDIGKTSVACAVGPSVNVNIITTKQLPSFIDR